MSTPFLISSSSIMVLSSLMAISSTNWLFLWAALELNLLSFIPIIMSSKKNQETEATVKYFMVQAIGSSVLLMSSMSLWFSYNLNTPLQYPSLLMFMALILKMGMVPCHMWYPSVMTSISWFSALILSTWQKLAPLIIVTFTFTKSISYLMVALAGINAIVGGLVGMNQSHLRTIMAYSSITHMGWMMSLIAIFKPVATITYFIIYSVIIAPMFIMFHIKNVSNTNSSNKLISQSPLYSMLIPVLLLSLSGLPPLTGFIPKWMTINMMANINPTLTLILIAGAMMNTYFYLNIAFNFLLSLKYYPKYISSMKQMTYSPLLLLATSSLLMFPLIMMLV